MIDAKTIAGYVKEAWHQWYEHHENDHLLNNGPGVYEFIGEFIADRLKKEISEEPVAEIQWSDDGYKIGLLGPLRAHRLPIGTKLYAAPGCLDTVDDAITELPESAPESITDWFDKNQDAEALALINDALEWNWLADDAPDDAEHRAAIDHIAARLAQLRTEQPAAVVDDSMVRRAAVAINAAWVGYDGDPRHRWKWIGSNERRHKDAVARAALTAAFSLENSDE